MHYCISKENNMNNFNEFTTDSKLTALETEMIFYKFAVITIILSGLALIQNT